jgi:uncharacterized protein YecT (DUF1311 family)
MRCLQPIIIFFCALSLCIGRDDVNQTLESSFKRADANLNIAYKKVCQLLDGTELESMKKAQRSWLGYCEAEALMLAGVTSEGGSSYSNDFVYEKTRLLEVRAAQLLQLEQRLRTLRK